MEELSYAGFENREDTGMKRAILRARTFAIAIILLSVAPFGLTQSAPSKADIEKRVDSTKRSR
jgi:hypothetical protein